MFKSKAFILETVGLKFREHGCSCTPVSENPNKPIILSIQFLLGAPLHRQIRTKP